MAKFILMPDQGAPLVYIDFALKFGAIQDPPGKSGLSSLAMSMLLRGTKQKNAKAFHEALDLLGAEIHLGKYKESMRVYGVTLAENLNKFFSLFGELLTEPSFDEEEFVKVKRQFKGALLDELGSDDDIAERRFHEYFLWGHPYGKMTSGSLSSIDNITLSDIKEFYATYFTSNMVVFSATGAFDRAKMKKLMEGILKKLPESKLKAMEVKTPILPKGKNLLLIDKPDRTQSQIFIGSKGISFRDPDYAALVIANHVFGGGSFSARLMHEVREKRGWSYGAYSSFRSGKEPLFFSMHTVPMTKDTIPATALMLKLFQSHCTKGIAKKEFEFAKKSLVNQNAFMQDTIRKRMDNKVSEELLGLPKGFYDDYIKRLKSVTYAKVQKALKKHMDSKNIFVLILGTVKNLEKDSSQLKGFRQLPVKKFDEEPSDIWVF